MPTGMSEMKISHKVPSNGAIHFHQKNILPFTMQDADTLSQPVANAPEKLRKLPLALAALCTAGAVWRVILALRQCYQSLVIVDDPSIRELNQVSALSEVAFAILLGAHAAALLWLSRNPLTFRWPLALGAALICGGFLGGALLDFWVFASLGVYALGIVGAVAILSRVTQFDWLSLYAGALTGSVAAWYVSTQSQDVVVGVFVVGPCIVYAFLGGILRRFIAKVV